jgi:hypothetical protein
MPQLAGAVPFDLIARKWHALARKRLLYYSELYRSGRWTHYYASREEFAAAMLDVIKAAKTWARLAGEEPPALSGKDDIKSAA